MDIDELQVPARYIVGIDLGTTNSAVSFVDTARKPYKVEDFPVMQVVASGEKSQLSLFPSFHYEAAPSEFSAEALRMPWDERGSRVVTGTFARDHGAMVSGRLVSSAKSWLSHSGVDRTAPLLPWHGASDVEKISPVLATSRYLLHMRNAWNHAHPEHPIETQDVVITVPASFDEIARELTVEAAATAGFPRIVLLEEPQAAFYAWINQHSQDWQSMVTAGQKILICDIGGGTTDFSLIQVKGNDDGSVQFHRIAVGDHLILGGDNLDLALAYHIERKITAGKKLLPRQFGALIRSCQRAKEVLLGENPPEKMTINIPGGGASLIGGSIQAEINREEALQILIEGFFPNVDLTAQPSTRQSGFQEFGLPYATDPAATKYLAAFLTSHRQVVSVNNADIDPARPDIILFNGGVFSSSVIRQRILDVLKQWFGSEQNRWEPVQFKNTNPELAVARGAAYFGLVRRGGGVRIVAGLARTYYMGIQSTEGAQALCLAPAGLQEGQDIDISDRTFDLLIRQPVEFPLFVSSRRTTDKSGELVPVDTLEMYALPPIRTVLRSGKKMEADIARVVLHVRLTEVGTLDLWCTEKDGNRNWKLQFDIRSATRTDIAAHKGEGEMAGFIDSETLAECRDSLIKIFRSRDGKTDDPQTLSRVLEAITGMGRNQWPPSLLRSFWEYLLELEPGRSISPVHEARWLNFMGFSLRPGYGYAVDDWRVKQTWHTYQKGVIHQRNQACMAEWWIFWRRIAGGLTSGQQRALAQPLIASMKILYSESENRKKVKTESQKFGIHELTEIWRLLASLEYLQTSIKEELGSIAIKFLVNRTDSLSEAGIWALGRFGARVPMYGPLNELVPQDVVSKWVLQIIKTIQPGPTAFLSLMQLCRKTDDRYRDIDSEVQQEALLFMQNGNAPQHLIELVQSGGGLDDEEQNRIFGEQLPSGLRLG